MLKDYDPLNIPKETQVQYEIKVIDEKEHDFGRIASNRVNYELYIQSKMYGL